MKCLNCDKQFEPKRPTAKFCSDNCRVKYHRKNGKKDTIKPFQMQALFNEIKIMVSNLNVTTNVFKPIEQPPTNYSINTPPQRTTPQNVLKSFEYYRAAKKECELQEQWETLKLEIESATNLTEKQKKLLTTSNI